MLKTISILLALLAYFTLAGCGTKGPLYIPEQRYPQSVEKSVPEANADARSRASP